MKLIVFDIDGTLLDSVVSDDLCFIQTFKDLHQINIEGADWNQYPYVTDAGITMEIFKNHKGRLPLPDEIDNIKSHFYHLLSSQQNNFTQVENAREWMDYLNENDAFEVALATGGWRETAELKCRTAELPIHSYILKSSNDHYDRSEIIKLAITEAKKKNGIEQFDAIWYFGDGLWDFRATQKLSIHFVGVDAQNNGKLSKAGVRKIIPHFRDMDKILGWLTT